MPVPRPTPMMGLRPEQCQAFGEIARMTGFHHSVRAFWAALDRMRRPAILLAAKSRGGSQDGRITHNQANPPSPGP